MIKISSRGIKNIYKKSKKLNCGVIIVEGSKYTGRILFSLEDLDKVKKYVWRIDNNGYVQACDFPRDTIIYIHRYLLETPDNMIVDHEDRNRLNNQRNNIKNVTYFENNTNQNKRKDNTSGITGVKFRRKTLSGRYVYAAQITINKKRITKEFSSYDKEDAISKAKEWRLEYSKRVNNKNGL